MKNMLLWSDSSCGRFVGLLSKGIIECALSATHARAHITPALQLALRGVASFPEPRTPFQTSPVRLVQSIQVGVSRESQSFKQVTRAEKHQPGQKGCKKREQDIPTPSSTFRLDNRTTTLACHGALSFCLPVESPPQRLGGTTPFVHAFGELHVVPLPRLRLEYRHHCGRARSPPPPAAAVAAAAAAVAPGSQEPMPRHRSVSKLSSREGQREREREREGGREREGERAQESRGSSLFFAFSREVWVVTSPSPIFNLPAAGLRDSCTTTHAGGTD